MHERCKVSRWREAVSAERLCWLAHRKFAELLRAGCAFLVRHPLLLSWTGREKGMDDRPAYSERGFDVMAEVLDRLKALRMEKKTGELAP